MTVHRFTFGLQHIEIALQSGGESVKTAIHRDSPGSPASVNQITFRAWQERLSRHNRFPSAVSLSQATAEGGSAPAATPGTPRGTGAPRGVGSFDSRVGCGHEYATRATSTGGREESAYHTVLDWLYWLRVCRVFITRLEKHVSFGRAITQ